MRISLTWLSAIVAVASIFSGLCFGLLEQRLVPAPESVPVSGSLATDSHYRSGEVRVTKIHLTEAYKKALPSEAAVDEKFFRVGRRGELSYYLSDFAGRRPSLNPPAVRFPALAADTAIFKTDLSVEGLDLWLSTYVPEDQPVRSNSLECEYRGSVRKNDSTRLNADTVKQRILVESTIEHFKTHKSTRYLTEFIITLRHTGDATAHVTIVMNQFGENRCWWKTMVLEGWIRRVEL
jgi:hypothetical protein